MNSALSNLLRPARLTQVVDIGANPIDGDPPYKPMLSAGLCQVIGVEPQEAALEKLRAQAGPNERYLPHVVGDGGSHVLNLCRASGMASLLEPDPAILEVFEAFKRWGEIVRRVPVNTRRLDEIDEIDEIEALDFLKIDVQGSELSVFRSGRAKLSRAIAIQTEVSFVRLYRDQPVLGDIDLELRGQGFVPHCLAALKKWPIAPCMINNDPIKPLNQLLEADFVYVRDFALPRSMSDEQLKHLALIAHHCYRSIDLALRCVMLLRQRGALADDAEQAYLASLRQAPMPGPG